MNNPTSMPSANGTGLARLRERLTMLDGNAATLTHGPVGDDDEATLVIPQVGDCVVAHAGTAKHLLHLSLSRLEERLDATRFIRVPVGRSRAKEIRSLGR